MNPSCTNGTGPRLQLGRVVVTPAALAALEAADVSGVLLLARHIRGDWGEVSEHDRL